MDLKSFRGIVMGLENILDDFLEDLKKFSLISLRSWLGLQPTLNLQVTTLTALHACKHSLLGNNVAY